jgi:hypothetical protein
MLRTFNYTKRKKIPKECLSFTVNKVGDKAYFNAVLKISDLDFQPDAKVFIEAYYGPTYIRFDFGTISNIRQPHDTNISEVFKISDKVLFRLRVVDENKGLLLGFANISTADDENKSHAAIFYVSASQMDTNEVWRMNFDMAGDGIPVLEINNAIEGIRDIARGDTKFLALVFPAAVRMVLSKIAEEDSFDREGDHWTSKWIVFTQDILGVVTTPEDNSDQDKLKSWYDDVVRSFCVRNKLIDHYIKSIS